MSNEWIKFSDKKPDGGKSVWLADGDGVSKYTSVFPTLRDPGDSGFTHWKYAEVPEPPKEPTQREFDQEAYLHYGAKTMCDHIGAMPAWRAALDYRDAQAREILKDFGLSASWNGASLRTVTGPALDRLCRLVGYEIK